MAPTYPTANGDQQLAYCLWVINHDGFNGPIQHFDLLGSLFLLVLQDVLPRRQHCSTDVQNQWIHTFLYLSMCFTSVYLWPEETTNLFNNVFYPIPQHVVIEGASWFQPDSFSRVIVRQEQPVIWRWNHCHIILQTYGSKYHIQKLCGANKYGRNK